MIGKILTWFKVSWEDWQILRLMYKKKYRWRCYRKNGGGDFETPPMTYGDMIAHLDTCGYKLMKVDHEHKFVFYSA